MFLMFKGDLNLSHNVKSNIKLAYMLSHNGLVTLLRHLFLSCVLQYTEEGMQWLHIIYK